MSLRTLVETQYQHGRPEGYPAIRGTRNQTTLPDWLASIVCTADEYAGAVQVCEADGSSLLSIEAEPVDDDVLDRGLRFLEGNAHEDEPEWRGWGRTWREWGDLYQHLGVEFLRRGLGDVRQRRAVRYRIVENACLSIDGLALERTSGDGLTHWILDGLDGGLASEEAYGGLILELVGICDVRRALAVADDLPGLLVVRWEAKQ